ncbi:hypothetical protein AB0M34_13725 [Nocardia sp. NPDC050193]
MSRIEHSATPQRASAGMALRALRGWGSKQVITAAAAAVIVGAVVGVATVLIPNPVFGRDIPPLPWNYPVWIATSILTGILVATYIRPGVPVPPGVAEPAVPSMDDGHEARSARIGGLAGVLAWFAVGCPVCNKVALLALGYTGALTWFAPFQPVLAVAALILSTYAVMERLRGQVVCPVPAPRKVLMP